MERKQHRKTFTFWMLQQTVACYLDLVPSRRVIHCIRAHASICGCVSSCDFAHDALCLESGFGSRGRRPKLYTRATCRWRQYRALGRWGVPESVPCPGGNSGLMVDDDVWDSVCFRLVGDSQHKLLILHQPRQHHWQDSFSAVALSVNWLQSSCFI